MFTFGLETDEGLDPGGGSLLSGDGETGREVAIEAVAVLAAGAVVVLGDGDGVTGGEGQPEEGYKDRETHLGAMLTDRSDLAGDGRSFYATAD